MRRSAGAIPGGMGQMKHWPAMPENDLAVDYRPAHARQRPIDLDEAKQIAAGMYATAEMLTRESEYDPPVLAIDPLDDIGSLVRSLTYGQMIDLAAALWSAKGDREITADTLPAILHSWATGHD